jgi:hypothetical protein
MDGKWSTSKFWYEVKVFHSLKWEIFLKGVRQGILRKKFNENYFENL